jgi:cell wall-associated NlpC family hydrolase
MLADGTTIELTLLHNGYVLGADAGSSSVDCSSLVSEAAIGGKFRLTTLDLRAMYHFHIRGRLPDPPKYVASRRKIIEKLAKGFAPVKIREGQRLLPGDLIVIRQATDSIGHVAMVSRYDSQTMNAKIVEASGTAGTVRERDFPISLDPRGAAIRHIRPGIMALRALASDNAACRWSGRSPAGT